MMNETTTLNHENVWNACDEAIANFLGHDEYSFDIVEVVADRVYEGLQKLSETNGYFSDVDFEILVESSSTFVQADLSSDELESWTAEVIDKLEAWDCY